ncbi:uncharacterized protein HD556DRAFT_1307354 [Suillus plorans]|uniref:Uncharacterized protein n=1 Tax=Suillus plorans TaxID=116603 RepID=A0A9P7DJJ0_9AGAM|nr:uncharacterized protein HD556DRAFT_1307354 [Suillus plorans]KAG1795664.1 hypothetical protein HD556DRAFT_1307354 [Suillus plorans]
MSPDDAKDKATLQSLHLSGAPEWIRRMMITSLKLVLQRATNSYSGLSNRGNARSIISGTPSSSESIHSQATRAGITLLEVEPSAAPLVPPSSNHPRNLDGDDRGKRGRGGRNSHTAQGGLPVARGTGLVERPAAVMQMMEVISQPSKVVRVLARGEKLEPDP